MTIVVISTSEVSGGGGGTLGVSVLPTAVSGSIIGPGTVTTDATTVTVTGGTSPYSYSWTCPADGLVTIDNPGVSYTSFTRNMPSYPRDFTRTIILVVTDAVGNTGGTTLTADFITTSGGGGGGVIP